MGGFGKVVGVGLSSMFALLLLMSSAGVIFALPMIGTFTIDIPKAEVSDLFMYPDTYEDPVQVLVQEIGELNAWAGQTITWTGGVANVQINAVIKMDRALMRNLVVKGVSVFSPSGVYEERPENIQMYLHERDTTVGLYISKVAMSDLKVVVYCVYLGYLNYENMSVHLA